MNNTITTNKTGMIRFLMLIVITLLSIGIYSCSKDEDDNVSPDELENEIGNLPGFGDKEGTPQGTAFNLPEGITVVGDITGDLCEDAEIRIGSGFLVSVCIGLRNDTDKDITVTLPAGLILISSTGEYQNGVLLRTGTVIVPANKTIQFILYTYCGNSSRLPSYATSVYSFGPITNSKLIARLINDLKDKKIDALDYIENGELNEYYGNVWLEVQNLLWFITENRGLTWDQFDAMYQETLNNISNK